MGKEKHQVLQPESPIPARIDELKRVMPEVVADGKVDWDRLREVLGEELDVGPEHYGLSWPGKREARRIAFQPSRLALHPEPKESVNFDKSENLVIEGENLEILKFLQKSYAGRIKMIYIDPPYNTGNDFVYKDDFSETVEAYEKKSGMRDDEGFALMTNRKTGGRFHSNWLSMMYPRLLLAKNLLADDGILFISIDDVEVHNLKLVLTELFGEETYIEEIIWKNKYGSGALTKGFANVHEYILCFSKQPIRNLMAPLNEDQIENYKLKDEKYDVRGGYLTQPLATTSKDERPNLVYPVLYKGKEIWPNKQWIWSEERMKAAMQNNEIVINENKGKYSVRMKQYLKDENGIIRKGKPTSILLGPFNQDGTEEVNKLLGDGIFDFPKPVELIKYLLSLQVNDEVWHSPIILDFFAGSGTTAQAVLELNNEDGGNRKFILVQMPEATPEDSEARKAGYETIADICKERVRRIIKKLKPEAKGKILDLGFRLFKLRPTSFTQWTGFSGDNLKEYEKELALFSSAVKEDAKEENLLSEVILREGFPITSKVSTLEYDEISIHKVESAACEHKLFVCLERKLDKRLTMTTFKKTGIGGEDVFVCLDEALSDEGKSRIVELCSLKVI